MKINRRTLHNDAGNLSGLTESVDIVACPFCGALLN